MEIRNQTLKRGIRVPCLLAAVSYTWKGGEKKRRLIRDANNSLNYYTMAQLHWSRNAAMIPLLFATSAVVTCFPRRTTFELSYDRGEQIVAANGVIYCICYNCRSYEAKLYSRAERCAGKRHSRWFRFSFVIIDRISKKKKKKEKKNCSRNRQYESYITTR